MPSRKRRFMEVEEEAGPPASPQQVPSLLARLRSFWVFACLMQFIYLFGDVFKIDKDFDIEDLEDECMNPGARLKLAEIGLCLLKSISSQRGLTSSDFDEYTSRQYKRRLPDQINPFGDDEQPLKFLDFDVFTQLRILYQLTLWTLLHPERVRDKMAEDRELDWRIDVVGWDHEDRSYFLLDDSRLYRRTDPPIEAPTKPKPKPKAKAGLKPAPTKMKPARLGIRASKRLKTSESEEPFIEPEAEIPDLEETAQQSDIPNDNEADMGDGYRWECVAITLQEYDDFLRSLQKSRDPNERNLHKYLTAEVLPQIEKAEENRQKKIAQRQRELWNLEKLAHAKRSSRIADKQEREREIAEIKAAEVKRRHDLAAAKADAARQKQMEDARESRMMTREQRLKEREYKRLLHEEELANMSKASEKLESGEAKISERHLKAEMARKQKELEELQQEEDWVFDCEKCGVYGENVDDGTPIVACDRCNVWQHCSCLGVPQEEAEKDAFHFVCNTCLRREEEAKQREEDAKKPKLPPIKLHVSSAPDTTPSQPRKRGRPRKHPLSEAQDSQPAAAGHDVDQKKRKPSEPDHVPGMPPMKKFKLPKPKTPAVSGPADAIPPSSIATTPMSNGYEAMRQTLFSGPTLSPQGQVNLPPMNGYPLPPPGLVSSPQSQSGLANGSHPSPYGQTRHPGIIAPVANNNTPNGYGYTNGHSPVKRPPLSPPAGSSPSLHSVPSPKIAPPQKDRQAAGLSPVKQSPAPSATPAAYSTNKPSLPFDYAATPSKIPSSPFVSERGITASNPGFPHYKSSQAVSDLGRAPTVETQHDTETSTKQPFPTTRTDLMADASTAPAVESTSTANLPPPSTHSVLPNTDPTPT